MKYNAQKCNKIKIKILQNSLNSEEGYIVLKYRSFKSACFAIQLCTDSWKRELYVLKINSIKFSVQVDFCNFRLRFYGFFQHWPNEKTYSLQLVLNCPEKAKWLWFAWFIIILPWNNPCKDFTQAFMQKDPHCLLKCFCCKTWAFLHAHMKPLVFDILLLCLKFSPLAPCNWMLLLSFRCGWVHFRPEPLQQLRHLLQHARLIQVQMQRRLQGDGPRL